MMNVPSITLHTVYGQPVGGTTQADLLVLVCCNAWFGHPPLPLGAFLQTNPLTTSLGAANIILYAGVYTPLKQLSVCNTWIGALVGAVPPLMGWASAAGHLEPGAWLLASALFFWQVGALQRRRPAVH